MLFAWSVAFAQHVAPLADDVIVAADLPWVATELGEPSLVHDGTKFAVVFDTLTPTDTCADARSTGYATSTDGVTWSVHPNPIYAPSDLHPCGFRDLSLLKADGRTQALAVDAATGAHVLLSRQRRQPRVQPTTGLEGLHEVSAVRWEGEWLAVGVDDAGAMVTAHSLDGLSWGQDSTVLSPGQAWWAVDAVRSPSLQCQDDAFWPWTLHLGGSDSNGTRTFTFGTSPDMTLWFYDLAVEGSAPSDAWDSWDVVTQGASAWSVYARAGALHVAAADDTLPTVAATRDCGR